MHRLIHAVLPAAIAAFLAATLGTGPATAAPGARTPELSAPAGATPVPAGSIPVFDDRVTHTRDLPTASLRRARKAMLAGRRISFDQMRELADHGDGLAAFRYAKRLVALDDPDLLSPAALYFATAAFTGRDYAVHGLLDILQRRDIEFTQKRLDHLENSLRALAMSGDQDAADGLIRLYVAGHPFGFAPEKARAFRADLAAAGDPDAALKLALQTLSDGVPQDTTQVTTLLETAAKAEALGTRATARNLLRMLKTAPESLGSAVADAGQSADMSAADRPDAQAQADATQEDTP